MIPAPFHLTENCFFSGFRPFPAQAEDQQCQQRAGEVARRVEPDVRDAAAAAGDEELDRLIAQGGKGTWQQRARPRKMRARAQRGGRQRAEHGVLGKVRALAQDVVGHVRQESLHHGQQRAALGAALRRGQARVSPDDQQPRTGADGQDAAGAAGHLPSASFCARILSTQHLWHMAT